LINSKAVMLGALPTARERHLAGSAPGMTALVEAESMTRRASAVMDGSGDASARRDLFSGEVLDTPAGRVYRLAHLRAAHSCDSDALIAPLEILRLTVTRQFLGFSDLLGGHSAF
jgi:hypothetical protein